MYDHIKKAVANGDVMLEWDYSKGQVTLSVSCTHIVIIIPLMSMMNNSSGYRDFYFCINQLDCMYVLKFSPRCLW